MSRLIILRGNSGSGKSTAAKALQQHLGHNIMVISQDAVRRDMLRVKDGPDTPALPLLQELLRYGGGHCETVILEGILRAQWYLPLFELALDIFSRQIFAYYYDLPFEETLRRHQTKPNREDFGEKEMRRWWVEKDFINIIPEKLIPPQMSLSDTLKMISSDLSPSSGQISSPHGTVEV